MCAGVCACARESENMQKHLGMPIEMFLTAVLGWVVAVVVVAIVVWLVM